MDSENAQGSETVSSIALWLLVGIFLLGIAIITFFVSSNFRTVTGNLLFRFLDIFGIDLILLVIAFCLVLIIKKIRK